MSRYKLELDSDGNLGIYHKTGGSQPDLWVGDILEPESPNPVLALGIPVGILGLRKILDVFDKWKASDHSKGRKRQPSPRSAKSRTPTRKWRKALVGRDRNPAR
jgi:hypothetical protein